MGAEAPTHGRESPPPPGHRQTTATGPIDNIWERRLCARDGSYCKIVILRRWIRFGSICLGLLLVSQNHLTRVHTYTHAVHTHAVHIAGSMLVCWIQNWTLGEPPIERFHIIIFSLVGDVRGPGKCSYCRFRFVPSATPGERLAHQAIHFRWCSFVLCGFSVILLLSFCCRIIFGCDSVSHMPGLSLSRRHDFRPPWDPFNLNV